MSLASLLRSRFSSRRRFLIGLAFLAVLLFLGQRTCESQGASATVVLRDDSPAAAGVRHVAVELVRPGQSERLGYFEAELPAGHGPELARWPVHADAGSYQLVIDLRGPDVFRTERRTVELTDRATITVHLEGPPPPSAPRGAAGGE